MTASVSITESQALAALRAFVLSVVDLAPSNVIRGLQNRVAMPTGDFIELTPILNSALSTDLQTYDRPNGQSDFERSTQMSVQVDCYGVQAMDRANALSILLRSDYACQSFSSSGIDMQPLYASDARQLQFVTGESQYMERWGFDAVLQMNPVVSVPQDFADQLTIGLINVDITFPP